MKKEVKVVGEQNNFSVAKVLSSAYDTQSAHSYPVFQDWLLENGSHPCELINFSYFLKDELISSIEKIFGKITYSNKSFVEMYNHNNQYEGYTESFVMESRLILKMDKVWIVLDCTLYHNCFYRDTNKNCGLITNEVACPSYIFFEEPKSNLVNNFYKVICSKRVSQRPAREDYINLIVKNSMGGLMLNSYKIKHFDLDFGDSYEDGFSEISHNIVEKLNKKDSKGILLLHGLPGTGKTTYIRYLLSKLTKRVIYVPPNLTSIISDPSFLSFLTEYNDSILVIEDAENVIKSRENAQNTEQSVSNILNLTDGILSDILNIQVICTFNTTLENIDSALLRPGRLIAEYEFKKLSVERAKKLADRIGVDKLVIEDKIKEPMLLSDIYNLKNDFYYSDFKDKQKNKKTIGFGK